MNTKNLLLAGLIGGLISTALSNIPIINFVNCLLCAGFWGEPCLRSGSTSARPVLSHWGRVSSSDSWREPFMGYSGSSSAWWGWLAPKL